MKTKIMKSKILFIALLFMAFMSKTNAQSVRDFETWNAASIKYDLNKKIDLSFETQWRLKENSSVTDAYFFELGGQYSLIKKLRLGANIRYIRKNDNKGAVQGYDNFLRFNIDLKYGIDISRFDLGFRLRYQNKDEMGITEADGNFSKHYYRFKTSLSYNIRKVDFTPYMGLEHFYKNNSTESEFYKYRLTLGVDYKLTKKHRLSLSYRFEKELNQIDPNKADIINLSYRYNL
jgi:opacity protein-like surface antigen